MYRLWVIAKNTGQHWFRVFKGRNPVFETRVINMITYQFMIEDERRQAILANKDKKFYDPDAELTEQYPDFYQRFPKIEIIYD